jgi:ribosomal protein S18 acetylase RimI-like enzyme
LRFLKLADEMQIDIKEFTIDDYDRVIALWKSCDGIALSGADSRESIRSYLERNQGMSFIAKHDETVIGAALSGHDGRRGYLHHLAVYSNYRHQGIARALVDRCILALQGAGIQKCHLFVLTDNQKGIQFWEHMEWMRRPDIEIISRNIESLSTRKS